MYLLIAVACGILASAVAEVAILSKTQTIYNRSPKLRIKGSGFEADEHNIYLDLSSNGHASLTLDKDYMITKDDEGLILKLLTNRKWADLEGRVPPVQLILRGVYLGSLNSANLLVEPLIVANILPTPTVNQNLQVIYQTATNEIRVNGTGFMGAKKVDLFFIPPLFKEIDYEMVSTFPLKANEVVMRLRHAYTWRNEPGPLSIVGVDTGGGPVKTNGEDGVRIAEVQADLDLHGVTVDSSAPDQVIYHDQSSIYINGDGFNTLGNTLRFANGILGKNVNYSTISTSSSQISLRLASGSVWRKNVASLPGFLTLLAVNAGEGFVAVGPTNAKKGRDIATVFERPAVYSSNTKLFESHSHELHILGAGFPKVLAKPKLRLEPPLTEGVDYDIYVMDRTEMILTLRDGKRWREDAGSLQIMAINTRGDEAGWVSFPGDGVHVAEVIADVGVEKTGGVEIYPSGNRVYQSALQEVITISGSGFKAKQMSITFEPPIKENVDYQMEVVTKNTINLRLISGRQWAPSAGYLIAKSISMDYKTFPLADNVGIRVAVILADPVVDAGNENLHETQSKVIAIFGRGFTNAADISVTVRPTEVGAFKIVAVMDDTIRIQLKEGYDWLPSYMSLEDEDESKKVPLQVVAINTGAGNVLLSPVTIGNVVRDRDGVVCDDTCEFAFDGVCDDGTESEYAEYYAENGFYQDDDQGGYYGENYGGDDGNMDAYYGEGPTDDYYMENDGYMVSACVEGTDCTDCGGVDAIVDWNQAPTLESGDDTCVNTCAYARDGVCDDPRGANYCNIGTDCQDCGAVGASNFTKNDDDGWWDDDDDYWTFNDNNVMDQNKGLAANRHRVKVNQRVEAVGPAAMFLTVLEGMVYTIGAVFAACAVYVIWRWNQGYAIPFIHVFNNEENSAERDLELAPTRRMPITPDVIRT